MTKCRKTSFPLFQGLALSSTPFHSLIFLALTHFQQSYPTFSPCFLLSPYIWLFLWSSRSAELRPPLLQVPLPSRIIYFYSSSPPCAIHLLRIRSKMSDLAFAPRLSPQLLDAPRMHLCLSPPCEGTQGTAVLLFGIWYPNTSPVHKEPQQPWHYLRSRRWKICVTSSYTLYIRWATACLSDQTHLCLPYSKASINLEGKGVMQVHINWRPDCLLLKLCWFVFLFCLRLGMGRKT